MENRAADCILSTPQAGYYDEQLIATESTLGTLPVGHYTSSLLLNYALQQCTVSMKLAILYYWVKYTSRKDLGRKWP